MASGDRLRALRGRAPLIPLLVALLALPAGTAGLYLSQSAAGREAALSRATLQLADDAHAIARNGSDPSRGVVPDFRRLAADSANLADRVQALRKGDAGSHTPAMPAAADEQVREVEQAWRDMKRSIDTVLGQEAAYSRTLANQAVVSDTGGRLAKGYAALARQLGEPRGNVAAALLATEQVAHAANLQNLARRIVNDGHDAGDTGRELAGELNDFASSQQALLAQAATAESLRALQADADALNQVVDTMVRDAPAVDTLLQSSAALPRQSNALIAAADNLSQRLEETGALPRWLPYASFGALGAALASLLVFGWLSYAGAVRGQREAEQRESQQQRAILRLLDEITNLANGDLTVDITVTEDFTGAIADSINYTVQTLRELAGTINATSSEIGTATGSTQRIARQMNEASLRQAREIVATTYAATQTSQSLQDMARRAEALSVQAQQSVGVAHTGAGTVGRTIQNMAALREQIQDTAKRIKRLGESSQEIGNITELINDIADQTNTLALNASIQAAMAGEGGRGFAVVADEVQRLAERAASATRQIETLVKTIQADTAEAIISMERSTTNVVAGAQSAEEAGQALTQIEASSQELSRLMQDVSLSARSQSGEVTRIAETMQGIREIAVQTSGSAQQTASAVGELNTLSEKLRSSVAGFKLPTPPG